jgi:hypothetical protein
MTLLLGKLELSRCPHCSVDTPSLDHRTHFQTNSHDGDYKRFWRVYICQRCGGAILACSEEEAGGVIEMYPKSRVVHETIPSPASEYFSQAIDSLHAPAVSVMLASSAVDAMLKAKGYSQGTLYSRINQAANDHVVTQEMAAWAHDVRLEANDPRHADDKHPLPSEADAKRCVEFASALADFFFVLPSRVARGRENVSSTDDA